MKVLSLMMFILMLTAYKGNTQTLSGKEIFVGNCQACHSIGGGDVVGPDLAGISERREESWIKAFIINSQNLIAEGDKEAVEVFNKYHKIAMPPHNFTEEEMTNLLGYIKETGKEASASNEQPAEETLEGPSDKEVIPAQASSEEAGWLVITLLSILGVAAAILIALAVYLFRML